LTGSAIVYLPDTFSVSEQKNLRVEIFDTLWSRIATAVDEEKKPGVHCMGWDGCEFASGIYIVD